MSYTSKLKFYIWERWETANILPLCQTWDYNHCSQNRDHLHYSRELDAHFPSFFCERFNIPNVTSVVLYKHLNVQNRNSCGLIRYKNWDLPITILNGTISWIDMFVYTYTSYDYDLELF